MAWFCDWPSGSVIAETLCVWCRFRFLLQSGVSWGYTFKQILHYNYITLLNTYTVQIFDFMSYFYVPSIYLWQRPQKTTAPQETPYTKSQLLFPLVLLYLQWCLRLSRVKGSWHPEQFGHWESGTQGGGTFKREM